MSTLSSPIDGIKAWQTPVLLPRDGPDRRLHGHIHENYSRDTGMGCDKDNSDSFYHWSGLPAYIAIDHDGQRNGDS